MSEGQTVVVSVRRIRRVLLAAVAALLALDQAVLFARFFLGRGRLWGLYSLFDLDVETSISTYFQSTLLLGAAISLWLLGRARPEARRVAWILAAATFWVSMDEASQIHELLIVPIRLLLDAGGVFRSAWVFPGLLAAVGVAILTGRLLRILDPDVRRLLVLGGALYLAGSIGLEMLGGAWADVHGTENAVYRMVFTSIEETLEGVGIVVALISLLEAVRRVSGLIGVGLAP